VIFLTERRLQGKKRIQLPTWFNANKYVGVHSLNATGWHQHLSVRQYCAQHVGPHKNGLFDEQDYQGVHDPAMKLLAALRRDPLDFAGAIASLVASGHPEVASSFESQYSTSGLSEIRRQNQVHSLTIEELFAQVRAIPGRKQKAANSYAAQTLGQLLTYGTLRRDWMWSISNCQIIF
jgi:hypothetical protein